MIRLLDITMECLFGCEFNISRTLVTQMYQNTKKLRKRQMKTKKMSKETTRECHLHVRVKNEMLASLSDEKSCVSAVERS